MSTIRAYRTTMRSSFHPTARSNLLGPESLDLSDDSLKTEEVINQGRCHGRIDGRPSQSW